MNKAASHQDQFIYTSIFLLLYAIYLQSLLFNRTLPSILFVAKVFIDFKQKKDIPLTLRVT